MKLFIKLLILILIIGLAAPFYFKRPDGQPWMNGKTVMDDTAQWWRDLQAKVGTAISSLSGESAKLESFGKTRVYRWQDAEGRWHMSDQPPAINPQAADVIWVDPNTNLIQGMPPTIQADVVAPESKNVESVAPTTVSSEIPLPLTVSPEQLQDLQRQVGEVKQQIQQRNNALADPSL